MSKVHLIPSEDLDHEFFTHVIELLHQFKGPLEFRAHEKVIVDVGRPKTFDTADDRTTATMETELDYHGIVRGFPRTERVLTWEELLKPCEEFRTKHELKEDELVILLTNRLNDKNWFGGTDKSTLFNVFVQCSDWDFFFDEDLDPAFPVVYEILSWCLRAYSYKNRKEMFKSTHQKSRGCLMDLCIDKTEIILKMRTGDLCRECLQKMTNSGLPHLVFKQITDGLESIRKNISFRHRFLMDRSPSSIIIRGYNKEIYFHELGNMRLGLSPKERAVYLLFLYHPEGILQQDLPDYSDELQDLYQRTSGIKDRETIEKAVNHIVSPLESGFDQLRSKIKRKLKTLVGETMLKNYTIQGGRNQVKRILLDREFVKEDE